MLEMALAREYFSSIVSAGGGLSLKNLCYEDVHFTNVT